MNNELIIATVGILGTVVGTWIGSSSTNKGQEKLFNLQKGQESLKFQEEIIRSRMEVYSEFKYADGQIEIAGNVFEEKFNIDLYRKQIRPVFQKKFYILPKELKQLLNNIDTEIALSTHFIDTPSNDEALFENYSNIHKLISEQLIEYEIIENLG